MDGPSTFGSQEPFGEPLRHLSSVDSTNGEALRWADETDPPPEGAVVLADSQTQGRGRWQREWISAPGASLVMSVILRPPWTDHRFGLLTVVTGLACAEAFDSLGLGPSGLKWPNDVLIDDGKVAGILIETRMRQGVPALAAVGIGVNLADPGLPSEIAERATSLASAAERRGLDAPARREVLRAILERLEAAYRQMGHPSSSDRLRAQVRDRMVMMGSELVLRTPDGDSLEGVAEDLGRDGSLCLRTDSGTVAVHAAEITSARPR